MNQFAYFNLFSPLEQADFDLLMQRTKPRSFKKGESLVVPGQTQKELYFIKSGVQMSFFETDTNLHVVAFTYPPNTCAIPESFSFQRPSNHSLVCLSNSEMDAIAYDDLQTVFSQSRAVETLFRRMTEAILAGMINRHIELHSMSIEERFKVFCQRSWHLLQMVPHKYIASYLGINPTNFSKLFNSVKL
ncbi:MAG TPA: Crp/Fnr family transcriptional regulator [Flavobacteriales bacterium]|nr:Crp/Fnr family transcriptional regulator [Flavobacteriales bacterium]